MRGRTHQITSETFSLICILEDPRSLIPELNHLDLGKEISPSHILPRLSLDSKCLYLYSSSVLLFSQAIKIISNINIHTDIYVTVPTQELAMEKVCSIVVLTPKSAILTYPFLLNNMLDGLMSL
jgi:hypothetical protein